MRRVKSDGSIDEGQGWVAAWLDNAARDAAATAMTGEIERSVFISRPPVSRKGTDAFERLIPIYDGEADGARSSCAPFRNRSACRPKILGGGMISPR